MNKAFLYGRIANDPIFYKYENKVYCVVSLEDSKSILVREDPIPCAIPCNDVELIKDRFRKGDYIGGEGFIGTHRDYKGVIRLHIVIDNAEFYFIGERGEHHEKDRL